MKFQIWYKDGQYAMVGGDKCDEPILKRTSKKVHEFEVGSWEQAYHVKEWFVKLREQNRRTA